MNPVNTNTRHVIFKKMKTARTVASIEITIFFSFSVLSSLSQNSMTFLIILVIFSTGMKMLVVKITLEITGHVH